MVKLIHLQKAWRASTMVENIVALTLLSIVSGLIVVLLTNVLGAVQAVKSQSIFSQETEILKKSNKNNINVIMESIPLHPSDLRIQIKSFYNGKKIKQPNNKIGLIVKPNENR